MAIIRQHHKDTGTTYVLTSESYWDPEKKQSRSRRKVIGKIDPKTGEVIPTGSKKTQNNEALTEKIRELEIQNDALQTRLNALERENKKLRAKNDELSQFRVKVQKLRNIVKNASSSLLEFLEMLGIDESEVLHIETGNIQEQCERGFERAGQSVEPVNGNL